MRYVCIKLNCTNDRDGNPRRGWAVHAVTDSGVGSMFAGWIDEGYGGRESLERGLWDAFNLSPASLKVTVIASHNITPGEYRELSRAPLNVFGVLTEAGTHVHGITAWYACPDRGERYAEGVANIGRTLSPSEARKILARGKSVAAHCYCRQHRVAPGVYEDTRAIIRVCRVGGAS